MDCLWLVNCDAGETIDDLDLAIVEIENTQHMNSAARGAKTYHLIISLQSSENLPEEALKDIERQFCRLSRFEDHQRVVAAHKNTNNFHLHVAYNMIHPETLNIHHPG
ncbi:MAG: relaxase/mobilization nuclease domain-containing protein [Alphaproteobacteria bacterium]|nr:relaxase/mobilization nuclease domain-containing protein [Alphaproteobacteria bacterium]